MPTPTYQEPYRLQIHFTPPTGWMNDPNGMVYYAGEYHLFYQFTSDIDPSTDKYWGHAISRDMIHWEHLPVALSPDPLGAIWSGSAVVDWANTSGLQTGNENVLVAMFTHFDQGHQTQSLAYSNDRGRTWRKYAGNPTIQNPGHKDFRDPKIYWHAETESWVMVLAAGDRVKFYTSSNLIDWAHISDFGQLEGAHGGVWECPDLFELPDDGGYDSKKWVLVVSVGNGAPSGGSGTQYFVGDFDGGTFSNHYPAAPAKWVDYGRDNYAGVTFSDIPGRDGRRIFIGWMNNWTYAYQIPTKPWMGAMTLPRELKMVSGTSGGLQLVSLPVAEMQSLRCEEFEIEASIVSGTKDFAIIEGPFEILVEFQIKSASQFGLSLDNDDGDRILVGYDLRVEKVFVDRRDSGKIDFDYSFGRHIHAAPLRIGSGILRLHVFVDRSSVEVFVDGGLVAITDLFFPKSKISKLGIYALDGEVRLLDGRAWKLASIWSSKVD